MLNQGWGSKESTSSSKLNQTWVVETFERSPIVKLYFLLKYRIHNLFSRFCVHELYVAKLKSLVLATGWKMVLVKNNRRPCFT